MKPIPKDKLDELIRITRKFARTGDADLLQAKHCVAYELSKIVFNDEFRWLCFSDLVGAIVGVHGLRTNAGNQTIYKAFEAVGYVVEDEEKAGDGDAEDD